ESSRQIKSPLVLVAAEKKDKHIGRIRLLSVLDASAISLIPSVEKIVEPGSFIHTDGWISYDGLNVFLIVKSIVTITKPSIQLPAKFLIAVFKTLSIKAILYFLILLFLNLFLLLKISSV
ncbi:hypothetical protein MNBD_GAMMA03-2088, partial [hydrothermal vent metagenome]